MKIITINVNKGGAGKTTLANNLAEYLAKDCRVLLFDFDDSANLTHRYIDDARYEETIMSLFDKGNVTPRRLTPNLSLVAAHQEVLLLKERVKARRQREIIFGKWLAQHEKELSQAYDILVIDTENDEDILSINALVVSDIVLGLAEAGKDNVVALAQLKRLVASLNQDFDNAATLYFIANKINFSKKASKELLKTLAGFPEMLGYLPEQTSLAEARALYSQEHPDKKTLEQVSALFGKLKKKMEAVK